MKKTNIILVSILSMIIFVATLTSCEKTELNQAEEIDLQTSEITTFEKFYNSIETRIISVTEDYKDEEGTRGTLYVIRTETGGEQEIVVLDKVQEKGGIPWVWRNGTLHSYDNGTYRCFGSATNCRVCFGITYVNLN